MATPLVPLALIVTFSAGAAVFGSRIGGAVTVVATLALVAFPRSGTGSLEFLALPASVGRLLLAPIVVAFAFAFLRQGSRSYLLTVGAAALALAVVHITYAIFLVILLAGFALARLVLPEGRRDARRMGVALGAVLVPTAIVSAALVPLLSETNVIRPGAVERARELANHGESLEIVGSFFSLTADTLTRGPAFVAAFLAVVATIFAPRTRWASYVVGGSLAVLLFLLVPPLFTALADLASLSQARRLSLFLPLAVALGGACIVLGQRTRVLGLVIALALGIVLQLVYPWDEVVVEGGAGAWPVWVAVAAALAALIAAPRLARRPLAATPRALACAVLFALPIGVAGLMDVERDRPDRHALTPGLVEAVDSEVGAGRDRLRGSGDLVPARRLHGGLRRGRSAGSRRERRAQPPVPTALSRGPLLLPRGARRRREGPHPRRCGCLLAGGRHDSARSRLRRVAASAALGGWALRAVRASRCVRVVTVTTSYPRHEDDWAGRFVADAVERLRRAGLEVDVVAPGVYQDYGLAYGDGVLANARRRPWAVPGLIGSLVRATRRAAAGADLVHAHWLPAGVAAAASGKPFVVTLHGTDVELAKRLPLLARPCPAPSAGCDRRLERARTRCRGAGSAARPRHPERRPSCRTTWARRASRRASSSSDGCRRRRASRTSSRQVRACASSSPATAPCERACRARSASSRPSELDALYRGAAVVACPSRREGFGLACAEAMAHGKPVVASAVGGLLDLVTHERTGLLVAPGDVNGLRAALERLLADRDLRRRLGEAGRAHVAAYCSWDRVTEATMAVYHEALHLRPSRLFF